MGSTEGEPPDRAGVWGPVTVFGLLSFLQGVIEPTEGLLAQPTRCGSSVGGAGRVKSAGSRRLLSLPWAIKPLLGLLCDLAPLGRSRRRNAVVAAGAVGATAFLILAVVPVAGGTPNALLAGLLVASLAVALADVATDALVVDRGHADGRTGRYQASQWFCLYASGVVTGTAGGVLSAGGRTRPALVACALAAAVTVVIAARGLREPPSRLSVRPARRVGWAWEAVAVAGFLAVENFSPFASTALIQVHMTGAVGLSATFFGDTLSALALSSMAAAAVYGLIGPRVRLRSLAVLSVALGVVSHLAYAGVGGPRSALAVSAIAGFAWTTATLIQFGLAARACPPGAAGTVFATFMAVSNLSAALATWLGGVWYERAAPTRGPTAAFHALIAAGAAVTALGWLVVPFLPADRETTADDG